MRSVITVLVSAAVTAMLTKYIADRVGKGSVEGQLRFGSFMWVIGAISLSLALAPVAATLAGHDKEFWAKLSLTVGFGIAALYCFGEAALVRGSFDAEGITLSTPWTGLKNEKWKDLRAVEFNDWCNWYTLTFSSGKKIRLSLYLSGHRSALEMAEARTGLDMASA